MNQQDHELAGKIVQHLNYGAELLDEGTRKRLLAARKVALSHYRERPEPVWGMAWAGHAAVRFGERRFDVRLLITVAALAAALIGVIYWQTRSPANDIAEIDLGLLTDDLPINAYLDGGFDSWLKRSSR
ncbi:MAG: DUF3619 family protein [Burkholderiales bacterium]|nr:DUF3619 family protein [Burkholderiales bacterium]